MAKNCVICKIKLAEGTYRPLCEDCFVDDKKWGLGTSPLKYPMETELFFAQRGRSYRIVRKWEPSS